VAENVEIAVLLNKGPSRVDVDILNREAVGNVEKLGAVQRCRNQGIELVAGVRGIKASEGRQ
jgi:hypothetical protein